MQELITVIVPIYKVEQYLSKCLDSIIAQTYQNLEIILIDDGSPDRCPDICDEYAKSDERIRVIHQKNGGLSAARNSGLEIANGKFICFVDSDDSIHPKMYENLHQHLKKYDADISICGYETVYEDSQFIPKNDIDESITVCTGREALGNLYLDYRSRITTTVAWNKLYKKEIFNDIRYNEKKIHEDEFIAHKILDKAGKVVYTDFSFYYYLQRDTSIMGKRFNVKRLDVLDALERRKLYFLDKGYKDLYEKSYIHYLEELFYHYHLVKKYCPMEKEIYQQLRKKFVDEYKSRGTVALPKRTQYKYDIFSNSPFLYSLANIFWILWIKRTMKGPPLYKDADMPKKMET